MERIFARLAALLIAGSAAAVPSPEHRERHTRENIVYKWTVAEEWRYDMVSGNYYIYVLPVLVEDFRVPWKPMPKVELPK